MKDETRSIRQNQIEKAAYELLAEKGYGGTSMLSIAKRARCSNETLYNWYGDKLGLFRTLVSRNAEVAKQVLEKALSEDESPLETLRKFGPILLTILLGEKAISLNRAAAADPTGELGAALSEAGRETVLPLLSQVFLSARSQNLVKFDNLADTVELYLGLLIGDLQIRRAIARVPEPAPESMHERSEKAMRRLLKVLCI
ncbi:MAG: TetR/AcrR family transcriptional regulator [Rhodobacteraceae bacterium]|nr:TetR/AcrR family transcriptional regulator [Paracoccaceae bacterium]